MPSSTNHHRESTTFAVLTTTPAYRSRSRVIAILTSTLLFAVKRHNNLDSNKLIVVKFSSQRDKEADNLWATQQLWASITTKDDSKSLRTHHYRKAKNFFFQGQPFTNEYPFSHSSYYKPNPIGHLHDGFILLTRPECFVKMLSNPNLSPPLGRKRQLEN